MLDKDFTEGVLNTEAPITLELKQRFTIKNIRLLHGAIGIATESGEFLDALKKHLYYGKSLDNTNLIEELGDLLFYISLCANVLGISLEEIKQINHNKLKARYDQKFSETAAIYRDLEKERNILEGV